MESEVHRRAVELVAAVAGGDAELGDVTAELRGHGFSSVEDVLALVRDMATTNRSRLVEQLKPIDFRALAQPADPAVTRTRTHQAPAVPVLLNGTLLDPADIARLDGTELHYVQTRDDQLLAIDDRQVMATWWQLMYVSGAAGSPLNAIPVHTASANPPPLPPFEPSTPIGPGAGGVDRSRVYDEADWHGEALLLRRGYTYPNLKEVGRGFLGFGDWNDVVSSVGVGYFDVTACVLHDHINLQGSTYSLFRPIRNLTDVGWNDRVSSITAL